MFKKFLRNDLEKVFETRDVRFHDVDGIVLGALYCEISEVHERIRSGAITFRVDGTIGRTDEEGLHQFGYLLNRAKMASDEKVGRFNFSSTEASASFIEDAGTFTKSTLQFTWTITLDYDNAAGEIGGVIINVRGKK